MHGGCEINQIPTDITAAAYAKILGNDDKMVSEMSPQNARLKCT